MAITKEAVLKDLTKNYQTVQKQELQYKEFVSKNTSVFDKSISENNQTLAQELEIIDRARKEIVAKYKNLRKEEDNRHKNVGVLLTSALKDAEQQHQKELKEADKLYQSVLKQLEKEQASLSTKQEKEKTQTTDALAKLKEQTESKKASLIEKRDSSILKLEEKMTAENEKHIEKLATIETKKQEKLEKITAVYEEKKQKLEEKNKLEQEKIAQWKKVRHEKYELELNTIVSNIQNEQTDYDTKHDAIVSSMDSRVARREKFLKRAQSEGDSNGVKIQTKEIKKIKSETQKEIKLLNKTHADESKALKERRLTFIKNYLEEISEVDLKLMKETEERLSELAELKANFEKGLAETEYDFAQKRKQEVEKNIRFFDDIEKKKATTIDDTERLLLELDHELVEATLQHDFTQKLIEIELEELSKELSTKMADAAVELETKKELADIALERAKEKHKMDEKLELAQTETNHKVLDEQELLDYHSTVHTWQQEQNKHQIRYAHAFTSLFTSQAIELKQYEEAELVNRYLLKSSFLQQQIDLIKNDFPNAVEYYQHMCQNDTVIFHEQIDLLSKEDLVELEQYKEAKLAEIEKVTEKRNMLNPRAYKKQIKELDQEIDSMKQTLASEVDKRTKLIKEKVAIFEQQIKEAEDRRDQAIKDVTLYVEEELNRLSLSLELLEELKQKELSNILERFNQTNDGAITLQEQTTKRNDQAIKSNNEYLGNRQQFQNDRIAMLESSFEYLKETLEQELQEQKNVLNNNEEYAIEQEKQRLSDHLKQLEEQKQKSKAQKESNEAVLAQKRSEQSEVFNKQAHRLDTKHKNHNTSIGNEVFSKTSALNKEEIQYEAAYSEAKEQFEKELRTIKVNFKNAIAKAEQTIQQKLKQDIASVS